MDNHYTCIHYYHPHQECITKRQNSLSFFRFILNLEKQKIHDTHIIFHNPKNEKNN